jgi:hypothetical protein
MYDREVLDSKESAAAPENDKSLIVDSSAERLLRS